MKLKDFLNDAFHNYGPRKGSLENQKDIEDFIYNYSRCLDMLYYYLDIGHRSGIENYNFVSLYRVQHIWITFLLGLGIAQKYNLLDKVNVMNNMPDQYLWMLTSIVHDYGYLKIGITKYPNLLDIDRYKLLDDNCSIAQLKPTDNYSVTYPQFLTYNYATIKGYYRYAKDRIFNNEINGLFSKDRETVDHGIFGACQCYNEYCDFYIAHTYPRYCISNKDDIDTVRQMGYNEFKINNSEAILRLAKSEPLLYKRHV